MEWISFSCSYAWQARIVAASITTKTMIHVKWYPTWKHQKLKKLLHVGAHGRMVRLMLWYSVVWQITHKKKQFNFKGQATYPTQRLAALHFTYLCHLYWEMIWNCQTISHCWHSLTIATRGWLQSIMWPIIHWLAASLLNNIPSLNMATLVQFSTMPFLWVNENFQS